MSNDNALSRQVAEVVGWRFVPVGGEWDSRYFKVFRPDGQQRGRGAYPEKGLVDIYPDYANDANLAMELMVDGFEFRISYIPKLHGKWLAIYFNETEELSFSAWGATPAEAICKARLALAKYLEVQDAK